MSARSRHSALALLALVALAAPATARADAGSAARARAASERCADADALPGQAAGDDLRDATLCLMNAERTARGLGRLQAEPLLGRVAVSYARQMVRGRFFDHTSPGGSTMLARVSATRYLRHVTSWSLGENLAWGTGPLSTPRATVRAWMQSPEHRDNMLTPRWREVGIAALQATSAPGAFGDEPTFLVTMDFGARGRRSAAGVSTTAKG